MADIEQLDREVAAEKQELWWMEANAWETERCSHDKEPSTCGWSHCSRCGSEYSCCSYHSNRNLAGAHLCGDLIDLAMRAEKEVIHDN